ncbi:radial spoke head protein 6 homolog A [Chelonus insularis]|uniref:radial spoke head protein 6 homolog A n=1 Tax=Chelonus insularis TaxID=460826 RepID=UPI001589238D|nr:radial spoke head protein 6 homolog A [Chelonus insularis]
MDHQYLGSSNDMDDDNESQSTSSTKLKLHEAKMFLHKQSSHCGEDLYTHISELLAKILTERPENVMDNFEIYSYRLKQERLRHQLNHREIFDIPIEHGEVEKLSKLFQVLSVKNEKELDEDDDNDDEDNDNPSNESEKTSTPNLLDIIHCLEHFDIALSRSECILLNFSIQNLIQEKPITDVRFWGKILGSVKNYYIIEAKLNDEEIVHRIEAQKNDDGTSEENSNSATDPIENTELTHDEKEIVDSTFLQPYQYDLISSMPIPHEVIGTGLNKTIYFVCNSPGIDDWIELPLVAPQQIVLAKQITWNFTGYLTAPVRTLPPFVGNESNYLRAQIARISAATLVSPKDYFTLNQDSTDSIEETEDNAEEITIEINPDFKQLPLRKYQLLSNWCHHSAYIFQQGRTSWWNPSERRTNTERSEDEETEDEESENDEESEKHVDHHEEVGPPLLTPLSNDSTPDNIPVWSTRLSTSMQSNTGVAIVRSHVWPGAYAFTTNKEIGNIYIGTGQKYDMNNYHPPLKFPIQNQYVIGPEVMEQQDPITKSVDNDN